METENDTKLAFLDTSVSKEPNDHLTTSVYRKPTLTDQYLTYDSHHPQSVKRFISETLSSQGRKSICHPFLFVMVILFLSFLQKVTKTRKPTAAAEPAIEFKSTAVLPCVKGLSEQLRRCLQQQGVRAVFKLETTIRSGLVRVKDAVDPAKIDVVVYRIPCECGKVYFSWKTNARQNKGARPRRPTSPYPDLRRSRTRSQHRTPTALG